MLKTLLPVIALLARVLAPKVLDWIETNKSIPAWLRPLISEVLTALLGALTAGMVIKQAAGRGTQVRKGVRKALA